MPKWSIAMYSDGVMQSWVSMTSSASTSAMPARAKASVIVRRTWGMTYSSSCRASFAASGSPTVRWPHPEIRAIGVVPGCAASQRSDTTTTPAAPSVIWQQSLRRRRPDTTGLAASTAIVLSAVSDQARVCARGLSFAFRRFSSPMARRCTSSIP